MKAYEKGVFQFLCTFFLDDGSIYGLRREGRVACVVHVIVNSICRVHVSSRPSENKGTIQL